MFTARTKSASSKFRQWHREPCLQKLRRHDNVPIMSSADVANDPSLCQVPTPKLTLTGEFYRLWLLARHRWSIGARPWLGIASAVAAVLVAIFLHFHILSPVLWRSGDVYAALPLTSEVARLPMSLLFPTSYLPLWAACAQLLIVIGLGELILGRWLTIVVAMVGHIGSTLFARILLESVHGHVLGLTPALAHALDTGPSAATTAVGACLLVTARMNRSALLLGVGLIAAALIAPGIDGIEHTTALAWGVIVGAFGYVVVARVSQARGVSTKELWSMRFTWLLHALKSLRWALAGMRGKD